jgi:hypothetical protein
MDTTLAYKTTASFTSEHHDNRIDETLALIRFEQTGPPIAIFRNLQNTPHALSNVRGYDYLHNPTSSQNRVVSQAVSKSRISLEGLLRFFKQDTCGREISDDTHKDEKASEPSVGSLQIGNDAFVFQHIIGNNQHLAVNVFTRLSLRYPNGLLSSYHIHARNLKSVVNSESRLDSVCFSTGMCLFSESLISSLSDLKKETRHAGLVPQVPSQAGWTLYELETMVRLSSMIADMIGLLQGKNRSDAPHIKIYVDLPDVQYYWTAFELLQQGEVTKSYVQDWMTAVDTRREAIWLRLHGTLLDMLKSRGLAPVDICLAEGAASLRNLLKGGVEDDNLPSVSRCLSTLQSQGSQASCWKQFLDHLDESSRPSDRESLGHLIHVFNTVKPALSRLRDTTKDATALTSQRPQLLVVVDDIAEWKIFDGAKSYLHIYQTKLYKDSKVRITGLFPLQKIFVEDDERSSLWARCPGSYIRIDDDDRLQTPENIVEKIYGPPYVQLLEQLN